MNLFKRPTTLFNKCRTFLTTGYIPVFSTTNRGIFRVGFKFVTVSTFLTKIGYNDSGVFSLVFSLRNNFKILKSVVQLISVQMMNVFTSFKSSTKVLFHNIPMKFGVIVPVSVYLHIPITVYVSLGKRLGTLYKWVSMSFKSKVVEPTKSFCMDCFVTFFNSAFTHLYILSHGKGDTYYGFD